VKAKLIFCSLLLLFAISLQAQVFAGISLANEYLGKARLDDPELGELSIVSNKVTAAIPIPIKKKEVFLLNQFSLSNIQMDLSNSENGVKIGQNYRMMNILAKRAENKLNYFIGSNTSITSIPEKKLNWDYLKGVAFAGFLKQDEDLKYGAALACLKKSGNIILFPIFIINWKLKNDTKISGVLPINLSIMNSHSNKFEYGFATGIQFSDVLIEQNEKEFSVNSMMWKSGPLVEWKVSKLIKVKFQTGSMLYSSYNIKDDDVDLFSASTDRSWFLSSQLMVGF